MSEADEFFSLFAQAPEPSSAPTPAPTWKVLLVDDEPDIHSVLRLALMGMRVEGRELELLDAHSAATAKDLLARHPDIALILLDVVMESELAGLDLVRHIRRDIGNHALQIVLVTGQPGYAPQREVVQDYAIDGYRLKSELTSDRIFVSVYAAIRTYAAFLELQCLRLDLEEQVRRRTAELENSHRRLSETEFALERIGVAIHWIDCGGRLLYVNDAACAMLGYSREELLGMTVQDFDPHFPGGQFRPLARPFRELGFGRFESANRRKDGRLVPVEVNLYYRENAPGDGHFIGFVTDISQRKEAEQALVRAKEEAEAASRAKSAFLANMSHELRTPMNAIVGLTHLLQRGVRDDAQRDKLQKISDSAHHLLSVINAVLDISKIEAGKFSLEVTDFEIDRVFQGVVGLVLEKARAKNLDLVIDIDPAFPPKLRGDPTRLAQALLNYAGNAVKFTERGSIVLKARIDEENEEALLARFEVRDTGIGIPPEALGRLFQSFEQADTGLNRRYGGAGLGLAITRRLAEMMGGGGGAESALGVGSTFWFTARLGKSEQVAERRPQTQWQARRALIVDDAPEAREVLADLLRSLFRRVDAAGDGKSALRLVVEADRAGDPFDLVVLDWRMPGLDGMETARRLRELPLSQPPAHLLATAYDEPELRENARQAGFLAVLTKPVTPSSLYDAVAELWNSASRSALAEPPASDIEARLARDFRQARLLLCEDNPVNQEVALELLREASLSVDLAENGAVAVDKARRCDYDLILMDIQMPVMDGLAAAAAIRALPGRASTPILAMTANAFGEDRQRCLEAGMNDHVAKPVDPDALFEALEKWLAPRRSAIVSKRAATEASADAGAEDLRAKLAAIPGLDAETGLNAMGGKMDRYAALLRRFVERHDDEASRVRACLTKGDWNGAERAAHSLKGAAGAVGAARLHSLATEINLAIRERREIESLADRLRIFEREWQPFAESVRALPGEFDADARPPNQARAEEIADRIENLLANDDIQAGEAMRAGAPLLRLAFGEPFEAVKRKIEEFDYPTALEALRALRRDGGDAGGATP
jgi:PAS domain S-box-containing protein